ncbi:MAG: TIGR00295 family protein, partial [Candidatus Bathyarchaeota archaeon]
MQILRIVGCSNRVITHCKAVSKLAVKIATKIKKKGIQVDIKLVTIGSLLHDIGRSKTHNVDHAITGSEIARSLSLPESIVNIIERHIGSGIPAAEAVQMGLPQKDLIPQSLEEKIVSYADKLITGNNEMNFNEALKKFAQDLGTNHPAV